MTMALSLRGLSASLGERTILTGIDLELPFGELHAVMGPNGSGKSTLCHVLSGKSEYQVEGSARLEDSDLLTMPVDERARAGLMQGFQYPVEVPGVRLGEFITEAAEEQGLNRSEIAKRVEAAAVRFEMERFLDRSVNDDLSGGEKKRSEIFQMAVLSPKVMILDEIDSGLDIDAVREVAEAVEGMRSPDVGIMMITHYSRILRYVVPDRVHVMIGGAIVDSGGPELAEELESGGYEAIRARLGLKEAKEAPSAPDPFSELPFEN
jgi:Fe-S cluster assembly ATP-binding protein